MLSINNPSFSSPPQVRGLIGVVHLAPMPGDPTHAGGGFAAVEARALADARALAKGGVDAIIIENFGSAPFVKGVAGDRLPPVQVAAMSRFVRAIAAIDEVGGLPLGVNCLRNDASAALGIAAATDAAFIRVNVHVGAMMTDQGLIEGEAATTLRDRLALGASERVAILADVLVKHAAPLGALDARTATRDTLERGLADGVIVTGEATGASISNARLDLVREAAEGAPVYIGSGLTVESAAQLAPRCHGAIVGTALKVGGDIHAPVEVDRVRALADAVAGRFLATASH
ncbi:MAG: phosphorybosylanthranilate isomerase [Proteobacteria bacterium]|nr:MAG: phosphorybosylanthranilate isomerase [Pseudomonadota bacterium]